MFDLRIHVYGAFQKTAPSHYSLPQYITNDTSHYPGSTGDTFNDLTWLVGDQHFPIPDAQLLGALSEDVANRYVVVTAASSGFFPGVQALLHSARKHLPHQHIIVYDLGLTEEQLKEVESESVCVCVRVCVCV